MPATELKVHRFGKKYFKLPEKYDTKNTAWIPANWWITKSKPLLRLNGADIALSAIYANSVVN